VNLFDTTQSALELAMRGAAMRHEVLADNIANANTPGFQRRDVDFHTTLRRALGGEPGDRVEASLAPESETFSARADGNGVDIDTENARLAENSLEYETLVQVARARTDIVMSAIGVR
jgi:flagellar basal-body rod protein FlgB